MRGRASFFYFKMVISVLGVRTGERERERERERDREYMRERVRGERERDSEGEKERESVGEGEFKENTGEESRLIYFICRKRKNLKRKKEVGDSEKESVGCCFHEQAA